MTRYRDPVTGDELTLGEKVAWEVTGVIRRWIVFLGIQAVFFVWLALGGWTALNLAWSDWAIVIENVTMLCLFMQTRRDAVVTRRILALEEAGALTLRHLEHIVEHHPDIPPLPPRRDAP